MKKKNLLIAFLAFFGFALTSFAQYCSPTFTGGCTSWKNQSITLDSIQWTLGTCTTSDYTSMHTTLQRGVAKSMTVVNGDWCGVGVWLDFNGNFTFEPTELLYNKYTAATTQTYSFTITVPTSAANGTYRMRVIAGWGTDCITTGGNGDGPCGTYQYGNFDDFTIKVIDPFTTVGETQNPETEGLIIGPNPVSTELNVKVNTGMVNSTYKLTDQFGKTVMDGKLSSENTIIDMAGLAAGMYLLYTDNDQKQVHKVIKK
jgi:lysyl endopeptidase